MAKIDIVMSFLKTHPEEWYTAQELKELLSFPSAKTVRHITQWGTNQGYLKRSKKYVQTQKGQRKVLCHQWDETKHSYSSKDQTSSSNRDRLYQALTKPNALYESVAEICRSANVSYSSGYRLMLEDLELSVLKCRALKLPMNFVKIRAVKSRASAMSRLKQGVEQAEYEGLAFSCITSFCEWIDVDYHSVRRCLKENPGLKKHIEDNLIGLDLIHAQKEKEIDSKHVVKSLKALIQQDVFAMDITDIAEHLDVSRSKLQYWMSVDSEISQLASFLTELGKFCDSPFGSHIEREAQFEIGSKICNKCRAKLHAARQRHRELDRLQIQNLRKEMERKAS